MPRSFDRTMILLCTGFTLLVGTMLRAADRPNILFIYTDDQAPTATSFAGNPQLKTPNIDRICHEGAWLVNSFVTTPVCSPARASLMTSRYGTELGITDWINPRAEPDLGLDPAIRTWPEMLQVAGYETGLVGKWHLGTRDRFHPTKTGFGYFMGIRGGGARPKDPTLEIDGKERKFEGFTADILTDHALAFLRRNHRQTFLLCMHYRAPHAAWLPVRDEDWAPYKNLDPVIPNPDYPKLNVEGVKKRTREYYASVASVDRNVGRLLDELESLKVAENTVVVFTSDHGYNLGHNAVWYKGNAQWQLTELPPQKWPGIPAKQRPNLYDQALRVPTVVRWPSAIEPGMEINQTISSIDWYPTVLAMAGVDLPREQTIRGHNFLPILRGEPVKWDNDFYCEYNMKHGATTAMRAVRTPKWKLMRDFHNQGRAELYDLINDPAETSNLIQSSDPKIQQIIEGLSKQIEAKMRQLNDPALANAKTTR